MIWKDGGLIWTYGDDSRTVAYIVYRGWADDYHWSVAYGGREGQEKGLEEAKAAAEKTLKDERLLNV